MLFLTVANTKSMYFCIGVLCPLSFDRHERFGKKEKELVRAFTSKAFQPNPKKTVRPNWSGFHIDIAVGYLYSDLNFTNKLQVGYSVFRHGHFDATNKRTTKNKSTANAIRIFYWTISSPCTDLAASKASSMLSDSWRGLFRLKDEQEPDQYK